MVVGTFVRIKSVRKTKQINEYVSGQEAFIGRLGVVEESPFNDEVCSKVRIFDTDRETHFFHHKDLEEEDMSEGF